MAKRAKPKGKGMSNAEVAAQPFDQAVHKTSMIKNEAALMVANGLSEAIMGFVPGGQGTQLSQVDTLFKNMRWYLVSNMRALLSEAYVEHGLVQTIVDVPVDDGLRGDVEIKSKQLSADNIAKLKALREREGDTNIAGQAIKWNRLYGGSAILIMTDQPAETPLDVDALKNTKHLKFRAIDLWELFYDKTNTSTGDEQTGPQLGQPDKFETFNYYGKKVHKTRILPIRGLEAPSFIRPRLRGWGFSIVESLVRSINQYLKSNNLGFEVLDEFKLDIFKIRGLTQALITPDGEDKIRRRVALANQQKNFQNALTMDAEDDYVQKQLSWSGLGDAMTGIRAQIASDMRIPQTKLFGQSAAGFNSGEDDIEVYNAMVESSVRSKCKFEMLRMIELRCMQLFGMVPDDLTIEFKPLRVLSSEQQENVKNSKFTRALQARQAGEITSLEFREVCNHGQLLEVQLDTSDAALQEVEDSRVPAPGEDTGKDEEDQDASEDDDGDDPKDEASDKGERAENTLEYDVNAYMTDGGAETIDSRHERELDNPDRMPDRALIERGKDASIEAFGKVVWQFVYWFYKQHGGRTK